MKKHKSGARLINNIALWGYVGVSQQEQPESGSSGSSIIGISGKAKKDTLPLPGQNNLLNVAFSAAEFWGAGRCDALLICFYISNNQLFPAYLIQPGNATLCLKSAGTDFEFNKPILKKGPPILKDFEKKHADFEGFQMDFEKCGMKNRDNCTHRVVVR